jgi:UDP-sugar pyrophosphorylase
MADAHEIGKIALEANTSILSNEELVIAASLLGAGQGHLFEKWPAPGIHDDDKRRLLKQAAELNAGFVMITCELC